MRFVERLAGFLLAAAGVRSRRHDTGVAEHHVYMAEGGGPLPTIVFLHGLSDSAASAALLLTHLRRRARRVIAVEGAGHGRSGLPRVEYDVRCHRASITQVLDALLDEPAVLVGNSLGGATAIHYAIERPERVRALLLTSPAGGAFDAEMIDELRRVFSPQTAAEARALVDRLFHRPGRLAPLVARILLSRTASPAVRDLVRTMTPADAFTPEELARLTAPLHILWGRSDRILPPPMLAYLRQHLPAAVITEPDDLGHCPHLEQPLQFARLVAEFAARHA
jgi:pimeloyl-ACP methyl ester carboxylesterase